MIKRLKGKYHKQFNEEQEKEEDQVDNKLELLKYTTKVQSRIKRDINSDYTLSKLNERDKIATVEMVSNAYFIKKILVNQAYKARNKTWYKRQWVITEWTKDQKIELIDQTNIIFDAYLNRIAMTNVMNRNVALNYLIRIISNYHEMPTEAEHEEEQPTRLRDRVVNMFKGKQKQEMEE